jgi:signal transduction histidine kinase
LCYGQQPCFYYKGKFYNAGNCKELQKIKKYNWHIAFTGKDEVWFSGKDNIYRFRDNKVTEIHFPGANYLVMITQVGPTVLVLKDSILLSFNKASEKFELYPALTVKTNNERIMDLGEGRYITAELVDTRHVNLYRLTINLATNTVERRFCCAYNKEMISTVFDKKNNVIRTTFADNSVIEKDAYSDTLRTTAEYQLNSYVSDVVVDNQGNRWFTLLHDGVEMFPKTTSNKISIPSKIKNPPTFCSIASNNGQVIVGNSDNTLFFIRHGSLQETHGEDFSARNNRILDIKIDKHGKLWLGSDGDIYQYNPALKHFSAMKAHTSVKDLKYDAPNDALLVASSNGALIVSCDGSLKITPINNERTTCIAGSLSDTCWFQAMDGLYTYHNGTAIRETTFSQQFSSRVTCLETDKRKRLWVATSSNGVFVVEHNKIAFHFTQANGLTSDICKNIFIDSLGDAWVCTNKGVSHINTSNGTFNITRYNDKNSLVDNNVNDIMVMNDTVYVAGSTGISFFNRGNTTDSYRFPIYITSVKAGGQEIAWGDSSITLSSRQNTLSISFSGLSYLSNGEIEYAYYIEGFNDEPLLTRNNSATFSKLAPGTYNFYVSATDVFGNKSLKAAHLQFTIVPEWYQLAWLRWLSALAAIVLAIFITFKYSKQFEKRKRLRSELKQTISRLELEAIHSQINPHFIFNCLNAIQSAIYKNNTETATYFINRFAKLMRQALMLSKESFISIDEECSFINNYLEVEKLRYNNSFEYSIDVAPGLNKSAPFVPAFILQPFIENAINHGIKYLKNEKGLITLRFEMAGRLIIHIEDNGIGINAARKINEQSSGMHRSKGTELILARVKSLNEIYNKGIEISITDKQDNGSNGRGTIVTISLSIL